MKSVGLNDRAKLIPHAAALYRQGRVVAPTVEEALLRVREKFPGLESIAIFACPVQPWPEGIWWEWLGRSRKT